jgi:uncharacterized protein (DUF3084 family)
MQEQLMLAKEDILQLEKEKAKLEIQSQDLKTTIKSLAEEETVLKGEMADIQVFII